MHRAILLAAVPLLIVGCAGQRGLTQPATFDTAQADARLSLRGNFYACQADRQSGGTGSPRLRVVSIQHDAASDSVLLAPGAAPTQVLASVAGSTRQLFANARFAWNTSGNAAVLTDVNNIETYACRRISYGEAVTIIRSEPAGGLGATAAERINP